MNLSIPNEQFITNNSYHISEMLVTFKELLTMYPNIVLYLDADGWEVFDTRVAKVLFRHKFKHVQKLSMDLKQFRHNRIELVKLYFSNPQKQFGGKRALNYFRQFYDEEQLKYFYNGRVQEKQNYSDNN